MIDPIYTNFFSITKTNRAVIHEGVHVRTNDDIYRMELPHFFDTMFSEDPFDTVNKAVSAYVDERIRDVVDEQLGDRITMTMGNVTLDEYVDQIIDGYLYVEIDVDLTDNPYRKSTMDITIGSEDYASGEDIVADFLRRSVAGIVLELMANEDFYDNLSDIIMEELEDYVVFDEDEEHEIA